MQQTVETHSYHACQLKVKANLEQAFIAIRLG